MTDDHTPPPPDVVPPRGLSLTDLIRLHDAAGTVVEVTRPGHVELDYYGTPLGVGPSTTEYLRMGRPRFTPTDQARLDALIAIRNVSPGDQL